MVDSCIRDYCSANQTNIVNFFAEDRYSLAQLRQKRKSYFLKIANLPSLNLNLQNEVGWNNKLNKLIKTEKKSFRIPAVIDSGLLNGRGYALFEFFPSEKALSSGNLLKDNFEEYLPQIIDFLFWLREVKIDIPLDKKNSHPLGNTNKKILLLVKQYSSDMNCRFPALEKIVQETTFSNKRLAHGEIKPWHLYGLDGNLGVIDAEWASNKILEHYDIVSCYARTFTRARNAIMADKLLRQYYQRCQKEGLDLNHFKKQFRGLLAWRAVGEYRDGSLSKKLNPEHQRLIERVIHNQFVYNYQS